MVVRRRIGLIILALTGCATPAAFEQRMSSLVGLSESELVSTLGAPDDAIAAPGGRRILHYDRLGSRGSRPSIGIGIGAGVGGGLFGGGRMASAGVGGGVGMGGPTDFRGPPPCRVTFEVQSGRVANYSSRGEACIATPS